MADDLRALDRWLVSDTWPSIPCPACKTGDLTYDEDSIAEVNTAESDRVRDDPNWDPEWLWGYFHGVLRCSRPSCREKVVVVGEYEVDMVSDSDSSTYGNYGAHYRVKYTIPALPIVTLPASTPQDVRARIDEAAQVIWTDPSAAASRLRLAIEELLDRQRIKVTTINKNHKRVKLQTHDRIVLLRSKNPRASEILEAVKWIGNQGSHNSRPLTVGEVLDGADLLAHALMILYDTTDREIARKVRAINKAKGLRTPRAGGRRARPGPGSLTPN